MSADELPPTRMRSEREKMLAGDLYGSVVTRDVPADVLAVGNPCRVVRRLSAPES